MGKMTSNNQLNLYGAVTKVPRGFRDFNLKQNVRQLYDRAFFRIKKNHKIDYRNYVTPGSYNLGDHAIASAALQQIEASTRKIVVNLINWGEIECAQKQSPILFSGSGYYSIESSRALGKRINRDIDFIRKEHISCSYFGIGVNYVGKSTELTLEDISPSGQKTLTDSLALATTISVRDLTSRNILQPLTATPIVITGDPALFIKSNHRPQHKVAHTSASLKIGINIPFHGPAANARVSNDLKAYIEFFRSFQKSTGCEYIQTVHFQNEILIGEIIQDHGIRLTQAIGDVQTLLTAYEGMNFHIGGMLHSCILAASVGTPCIGLAYDIKHQGFFDLIGQPTLCIPAKPFDADRLRALCDYVLRNTSTISSQINSKRNELEIISNEFLSRTLRTLFQST